MRQVGDGLHLVREEEAPLRRRQGLEPRAEGRRTGVVRRGVEAAVRMEALDPFVQRGRLEALGQGGRLVDVRSVWPARPAGSWDPGPAG